MLKRILKHIFYLLKGNIVMNSDWIYYDPMKLNLTPSNAWWRPMLPLPCNHHLRQTCTNIGGWHTFSIKNFKGFAKLYVGIL
jgi:hypothetical protein